MADDFRQMMRTSMARGVADATLRVWAPQGRRGAVRPPGRARRSRTSPIVPSQVVRSDPRVPDRLVGRRVPRLPRGGAGPAQAARCRAARARGCSSSSTTRSSARVSCKATWSDDTTLTTRINPAVAHYTGQTELAVGDPGRPRRQGRPATRPPRPIKLGRAAQLAAETGNDEATNRLKKVVDIDDADTGTVRLKREASKLDEMALDTALDEDHPGALMTLRVPEGSPVVAPPTSATCAARPSTPPRRRRSSRPAASVHRRPRRRRRR